MTRRTLGDEELVGVTILALVAVALGLVVVGGVLAHLVFCH